MSWRTATALDVLLDEINVAAPNRNKISDGSIGDAAHAAGWENSDHNPWLNGVVRARDFTHDPAGGLNCDELAVQLAGLLGKHPALGPGAYVIWEGRIISTDRLSEGWRPYSGSNAHTKHAHLSVGLSGYDSPAPWGVLNQEDDMADYAGQLDRIEKLAKKAADQAERARKGSFERDKKVLEALDVLEMDLTKTARKTQVDKIKALLKADAVEEDS